jgi:hypothetical protein
MPTQYLSANTLAILMINQHRRPIVATEEQK